MQLHITFSVSSCPLPINYRPLVHGMIYKVLSEDESFSNRLHGGRMTDGKKRPIKGFTFSPLMGNYTIQGRTIWFHNQIRLEIRGWSEELMERMRCFFSPRQTVQIGTETLKVEACRLEDARLNTESVPIRMLSPVVVYYTDEANHTVFLSPTEEQFYKGLISNARKKCQRFLPGEPFELRILSMNDVSPKKQFSMFKKTYITGWYGSPRIIDMLYQVGLGAKNSEGYGMFLLSEKPENAGSMNEAAII